MLRKKILLVIPSVRQNDVFFLNIYKFINSLEGKCRLSVLLEKWQDMSALQNRAADIFLSQDFDYLLFIEDDVIGHTPEMLQALIDADAPVVAMQAYQRHFPYPNLLGRDQDCGYGDIELTGFQMLLVRRDAFSYLQKPYFIAQFDGVNEWATDQVFFARLKMAGCKILGCWDFCLNHAGITKENVGELREKNAPRWIDRYLASQNRS